MLQPFHHLLDQLTGIFLAFLGEMEIDHGGLNIGWGEISTTDADYHIFADAMP